MKQREQEKIPSEVALWWAEVFGQQWRRNVNRFKMFQNLRIAKTGEDQSSMGVRKKDMSLMTQISGISSVRMQWDGQHLMCTRFGGRV